jgi:hypothetical protein
LAANALAANYGDCAENQSVLHRLVTFIPA